MKSAKQYISKCLLILLAIVMVIFSSSLSISAVSSSYSATIKTTLVNGSTQRGSKKTFDVIARNRNGQKIVSSVTFNGNKISKTWDDTDKTSYTLNFTKEGANNISVEAGGTTLIYSIIYKKASKGDVIGTATWSIELFTIGCGYLVEPVKVNIIEGENASHSLIRVLHQNGYVGYYGGTTNAAFYLAYIADGSKTQKSYNGYSNSRNSNGVPTSPKPLNLLPKIPSILYHPLENTMTYFDDNDYKNWTGYIGELIFTNGSGWMYSINNIFPNVSFSDSYLLDGDVVRVQYTLGYGADIGGASAMDGAGDTSPAGNFFEIANKDRLTNLMANVRENRLLSKVDIKSDYDSAATLLKTLNSSQNQIDNAFNSLNESVSKYNASGNTTTGVGEANGTSNGGSIASSSGGIGSSSSHGITGSSSVQNNNTAPQPSAPNSNNPSNAENLNNLQNSTLDEGSGSINAQQNPSNSSSDENGTKSDNVFSIQKKGRRWILWVVLSIVIASILALVCYIMLTEQTIFAKHGLRKRR